MALVNINAPTLITPLAPKLVVTTSATAIVAAVTTDHAVRGNSLILTNIDGVNACDVTVDVFRSAVAYRLGVTISVPADAALEFFKRHIWLLPGDALRITAAVNGDIEAQFFGEEFS